MLYFFSFCMEEYCNALLSCPAARRLQFIQNAAAAARMLTTAKMSEHIISRTSLLLSSYLFVLSYIYI